MSNYGGSMKLSKSIKILIGLTTVWVAAYPLLFFIVWLFMMFSIGFTPPSSGEGFPLFMVPFFAIFPLHCITILLQFGLSIFYLVHIIKNRDASETLRIILGVGTFFLPFVAMPIYYYLFVWPEQPPAWVTAQGSEPS
jgi:hypothetical protein